MARRYVDERFKTGRAFAAYVDLLDAADSVRDRMSRHLETLDLTMMQFRVLETLARNGPQYQQVLSRKFRCPKDQVASVLRSLEGCGYVRKEAARLAQTSAEGWVNPRNAAKMKRAPRGRPVKLVRLTTEGEKLIGYVFPKHAKVVKAEMRVLEGREQATLSRLCRKLKDGIR